MKKILNYFRKFFFAGFLVWFPLITTIVVVRYVVTLLDNLFSFIPKPYRLENLIGFEIPYFGIIVAVLIILITGIIVANYLGKSLVFYGENILDRIPLVRSIYKTIKQMTNALSTSKESFKSSCLIEYPRRGIWTLAFITKETKGEVQHKVSEEVVNVFVPTTPNPTSGFLLMVPKKDVIKLDMKPDDAIKMIMSAGIVMPEWNEDEHNIAPNQTYSTSNNPTNNNP